MDFAREYDWRSLVAANRPSPGSKLQLARLELLGDITRELEAWCSTYALWSDRVPACAYTSAVSTAYPPVLPEATLIARLVLWIYTLDDRVDRSGSISLDPDSAVASVHTQLTTAIAPLQELRFITREQAAQWGVDWRLKEGEQPDRKAVLHQEAFIDLCRYMLIAVDSSQRSEGRRLFVIQNFGEQLARMIGAWNSEANDSISARRSPAEVRVPRLDEYLARGALSIAFRVIAAIPACFEDDPERAWAGCEDAMEVGARIARLANDVSSYETEVDEQKINAVTIALAQLGFDPFRKYGEGSPEVMQAKTLARAQLEREIKRFVPLAARLSGGRLTFWVQMMPALALAMFDRGNYVAPA